MKPYLSKSRFIRGIQCYKSLWLYKYKPDLITPPDQTKRMFFATGKEVGILARKLFPEGKEIVFEKAQLSGMIEKTLTLISNNTGVIYEATFIYDNILVMTDILRKGREGWEIYEVKNSTGVKDTHAYDLSIQCHVISESGLNISKACLIYINNQYIRKGELDIKELFTCADLTGRVTTNHEFIVNELSNMRMMLKGDCPDIDIGRHCTYPFKCDFIDHCWSHIPKNSVFDLKGKGVNKFVCYKQGIIRFADLKIEELNRKQTMQVEAELTGKDIIKNKKIKIFLDTLYYPLYFLDFETFQSPIPPFNGTRPYEQVPFQYSLHFIESKDSEMKHYEFLAEPGVDQREELIKKLIDQIPDNACILTYNMKFEKLVLKNLGEEFPLYKKNIMIIHNNIMDLMAPFQSGYCYTKEMKGSYSLKYVLPALVPELSYNNLNISDGEAAMRAYLSLSSIEDNCEKERIKTDLLEYCKVDTLAMVKLIERLKEIVGGL